jgi:hypothetical protein
VIAGLLREPARVYAGQSFTCPSTTPRLALCGCTTRS